MNPSAMSCSAALRSSGTSGKSVSSSPITSSLIQWVSRASRARCAVNTASLAVKHPAVFGRMMYFSRRRSWMRLSPDVSLRLTRRIATVTISVPLALNASSMVSGFGYRADPRMRRDCSVLSAIFSESIE